MNRQKPFASLSLDLDNQWSYMKTHGDPGWETFPSYLDLVVPRILKFLKERDLVITFFIVGQDAAFEKNRAAIKSLVDEGHEIGNHSFHHEPWIDTYTEQQIEAEIVLAEETIANITGCKPVGFRGPGYVISQSAIEVLMQRNYQYDASSLPTYIGPLARLYYFMTARLSSEEKLKRKCLFGSFSDGLRPISPYLLKSMLAGSDRQMIEIPVTTMPILKIPFHVSYIIYMCGFSRILALLYFKIALKLCQITGIHPSLLLHPLDFLGCDDVAELSFFPAMNCSKDDKIKLVGEIIKIYIENFTVVTLGQHAIESSKKASCSTIKKILRNEYDQTMN